MGQKGWGIVAFAIVLVVAFFAWEWFLSPEARVSRTLNAAAAAAEAVDAAGLSSFLAPDYSDYRHADRAAIEKMIASAFERVDRLNVTLRAIDVVVNGDEATARFDLVVVAFQGEDRYVVVGTPFEPEKIESTLKREPDGWKLVRVERGSLGP